MYDFIIVGSGLFGAVFAQRVKAKGKRCIVLERRGHIGGNIYTEEIEGINVHKYGAHIFHTSDGEVWKYINEFADFNNYINTPIANYNGEIYNMPFNMNTFNKMWGVITPEQAAAKINEGRNEIKGEPRNLEEQAISLVGRDIYEKLVKGYTEKQWGRKCSELPASIIRRLPVRMTYCNNYFNDTWQGIPIGGYTNIIERLLDGVEVKLNTDFLKNKEEYKGMAKAVIYTGAIDEYYEYCFGPLEYRSLRFETEIIDTPNYQGVAVMNYTDEKTPYTRVIEHKHFEFGEQSKTVISREYSLEWNVGTEPYYPINDDKNQKRYEQYKSLAEKDNIYFCGRLGEYRYYDMDDTVKSALDKSRGLIK